MKYISLLNLTHKNNVINIDDFLDEFERLDELPEIQEFMENMNMEVRKKDLPQPNAKQDTNTSFTTGLTLEISVAIIISSESDVKSILLNKVHNRTCLKLMSNKTLTPFLLQA
jgi:hypothetical protein